jgi:glutamate synthase (ferredoxin)
MKRGLYDSRYEHDACGIGFVVDIKGRKSRRIVDQALEALNNLNHRGACGCEANTGDGAGILIQLPHAFLKKAARAKRISLPEPGRYGVGMGFLPKDAGPREEAQKAFEKIVKEEGQTFLGWRAVPTDNRALGATARSGEPAIHQCFIGGFRAEALCHSKARGTFPQNLFPEFVFEDRRL